MGRGAQQRAWCGGAERVAGRVAGSVRLKLLPQAAPPAGGRATGINTLTHTHGDVHQHRSYVLLHSPLLPPSLLPCRWAIGMNHLRATGSSLGDTEPWIYKKGPAFGMPGIHVDGMDVLKVRRVGERKVGS